LNFGQTIWDDKSEVLLGTFWGTTWKLGDPCANPMETHRKHNGNKERKQKITPLHRVHGTFIFKTVGHHLLSNGMARQCPQKR
jgi:hypothetical protein